MIVEELRMLSSILTDKADKKIWTELQNLDWSYTDQLYERVFGHTKLHKEAKAGALAYVYLRIVEPDQILYNTDDRLGGSDDYLHFMICANTHVWQEVTELNNGDAIHHVGMIDELPLIENDIMIRRAAKLYNKHFNTVPVALRKCICY